MTWEWFVSSPINNFGIAVNAGRYAHYSDVYLGEAAPLTLDCWPLAYHEVAAKQQFAQAVPMLACFEHWLGPYPWYDKGSGSSKRHIRVWSSRARRRTDHNRDEACDGSVTCGPRMTWIGLERIQIPARGSFSTKKTHNPRLVETTPAPARSKFALSVKSAASSLLLSLFSAYADAPMRVDGGVLGGTTGGSPRNGSNVASSPPPSTQRAIIDSAIAKSPRR